MTNLSSTSHLPVSYQTALDAIKAEPAVSIWISRSAGRQWFAGNVKISHNVVSALSSKGLIKFHSIKESIYDTIIAV